MVIQQPKNLQLLTILLVLFSGFFLVGINKYLSPVYIIFLLSFPIFFANLAKTGKLEKISMLIILLYILPTLTILLYQQSYIGLEHGIINETGRHILPFLYLIISIHFISKINIKYIAYLFIKFNIYLLVIEFIYRFLITLKTTGLSLNFYSYKYLSFMYPDSNFVAMHIIGLFFFVHIYINYYGSNRYLKVSKILILTLLILTFSRTAYIILAMYYAYEFVTGYKKSYFRFFVTILLILFSLFIMRYIFIAILDDGSFGTKLHILNGFIDIFFTNMNLFTLLFGIGSGNSSNFINIDSHNIFGLVLEMGFIWFILYSTTIIYLIKKAGREGFLFFYPVFISAIVSLLPITYMSFYYIGLVLLIHMKEKTVQLTK